MHSFPLSDSLDNLILMHRDTHFGGSFEFMLDYYRKAGRGVSPDFTISQIEDLASMEIQSQENLAAILLTGSEAECVARAKEAYKALRDLYEIKKPESKYPLLIADLILTESEDAQKEIEAIVQEKANIVRSLIDLLRSEDFYDPLFPGYGLAPTLAAQCLGLIGDKRAIISLFESLGTEENYDEDIALKALKTIGQPAKEFLLKVVHGKPINEDNERAAIALIEFKEDPEVAIVCFKMLQDAEVQKDQTLCTYLILACEGLNQTPYKEEFVKMSLDSSLPKTLQLDIKTIIKEWLDPHSEEK